MKSASVIIPTCDRPAQLQRCLDSLARQTEPDFEVIVVDNGSTQQRKSIVEHCASRYPVDLRYLMCTPSGLSRARHAGVDAATSSLLLFVDDDATPDPRWVESYIAAFTRHPTMEAAGGPIKPVWEEDPPQWLKELIGAGSTFVPFALMTDRYPTLSPDNFFFGANMAVRRGVFDEIGGFNPEAIAERWIGDGDTGIYNKLRARQSLIGHVSSASVFHHIERRRMTMTWMLRRSLNQGHADTYSDYRLELPGRLRLLADAMWALLRAGLKLIKYLVSFRRVQRTRTRIRAYYYVGRARYGLRLMIDAHLRRVVMSPHLVEG